MGRSRKSKRWDKETKTRRRFLQVHHHIGYVDAGSAYCNACQVFVKWDKANAFDPTEWQAHMQTWEHGEKARERTANLKAEKRARAGESTTPAVHSDFELRTLKHLGKENEEPQSEVVGELALPTRKDQEDLLEEKPVSQYPTRFRRKAEVVLSDLVVPPGKDDLEETMSEHPIRFRRKAGIFEEPGIAK